MTKALMYYANNPDQEQMVWLVWEYANNRPVLAVICTTNADLSRYVADDRKTLLGSEQPCYCERVMCDHRYGAHDMSIAMNLMRRL